MIARAITQIQTHRRNRHGSWRDGKGGVLVAQALSESEVEGGADVAAPPESSKATQVISEPTFAVIQPQRWRTPAPPTPAPAAGHNAGALASLEDSARLEALYTPH